MHKSSIIRMKWFADNYCNKSSNVLDVGSQDINGSYRNLFSNYTGLDMVKGKNVDIIESNPYRWTVKSGKYDVVISGQAFEHIEFFWETLGEMVRVLKKDGLICIIAPNGFKEHRYPVDCYRFYTDGMIAIAKYYKLDVIHAHTNYGKDIDWYSINDADSMIIARKPYEGLAKINLFNYKCTPYKHNELSGSLRPLDKLIERQLRFNEFVFKIKIAIKRLRLFK